jgi:hypothetical protein
MLKLQHYLITQILNIKYYERKDKYNSIKNSHHSNVRGYNKLIKVTSNGFQSINYFQKRTYK